MQFAIGSSNNSNSKEVPSIFRQEYFLHVYMSTDHTQVQIYQEQWLKLEGSTFGITFGINVWDGWWRGGVEYL